MPGGIFSTVIVEPLYNGFIFLIGITPGGSVGASIIILTLLVRTLILPLSHKASISQVKMRALAPELEAIQKKYKDRAEQSKKTFELYQKHHVNPFTSCISAVIQIPVVLGLFYVFYRWFPHFTNGINPDLIYSFVPIPQKVNMVFLGVFNLGGKSILFAFLAALAQFLQLRYMSPVASGDNSKGASFGQDLMKNMTQQMKYTVPIVILVGGYATSAAVALYWTTSNTFSFLHEWYVRRKVARQGLLKVAGEEPAENKGEIKTSN